MSAYSSGLNRRTFQKQNEGQVGAPRPRYYSGPDPDEPTEFGVGEFWFDEHAADAAVRFFPEYLRFSKGDFANKPFELQSWQADYLIRPIFGWKRHDHADAAQCSRRYRRAYLEVPKKNGKTEIAAGLGLLLLVGDGELGGEGYAIAANKDQAAIVFNAATAMVSFSEALADDLTAFKTAIYCPELNAGFQPLTGKPDGKHGKMPSFVIGDEVHEWVDGRLWDFVVTGAAARRQPLEIMITTAGERKGYGWEQHNRHRQIAEGIVDDPETLVAIYAADPEDDWTDPKVWAAANPNFGVSVKADYLQRKCREAAQDPSEENTYKRYHLNLWTAQDKRWLQMARWARCTEYPDDPDFWKELENMLYGRKAWGGLDLASTEDIAAHSLVFEPFEPLNRWVILPRMWIPHENMIERVRRDKVPYDKWVAIGALLTTEGDVTDYDFIEKSIKDDCENFDMQGIGYDPWNAQQLVNNLTDAGLPMVKFGQTIHNFAAPTKEFKRLARAGRFEHGNHPVLRWMADNMAIKKDPNDNERPAKDKASEKIDGIVAAIMALGLATGGEEADDGYLPDNYGALMS